MVYSDLFSLKRIVEKNKFGWQSVFKIFCINNLDNFFGKENGKLAWSSYTHTASHGKMSRVYFTHCLHMDMQYVTETAL